MRIKVLVYSTNFWN